MIRFKHWDCLLRRDKYLVGDRICLQLVDANNGELIATATVNLPETPLEDGEVFIKDYSENEGMLDALVEAGVVEDTGRRVLSGFVSIPVCRILEVEGT